MLFLKDYEESKFKRRIAGVVFSLKWQNIYRELEFISFGRHVADDTQLGADEGWGLSVNIVGLHLFIGCSLEAIGRRS
jgi:hypothetical protein